MNRQKWLVALLLIGCSALTGALGYTAGTHNGEVVTVFAAHTITVAEVSFITQQQEVSCYLSWPIEGNVSLSPNEIKAFVLPYIPSGHSLIIKILRFNNLTNEKSITSSKLAQNVSFITTEAFLQGSPFWGMKTFDDIQATASDWYLGGYPTSSTTQYGFRFENHNNSTIAITFAASIDQPYC